MCVNTISSIPALSLIGLSKGKAIFIHIITESITAGHQLQVHSSVLRMLRVLQQCEIPRKMQLWSKFLAHASLSQAIYGLAFFFQVSAWHKGMPRFSLLFHVAKLAILQKSFSHYCLVITRGLFKDQGVVKIYSGYVVCRWICTISTRIRGITFLRFGCDNSPNEFHLLWLTCYTRI